MNKILAKTIGKWKIWAIVAAVIITAGVIVSAIFGFNPSPLVGDTKTVTVRVESYLSDTQKEKIGEICVAEFNKVGAYTEYDVEGSIANGKVTEFIFTFDEKVERAKLEEAKGKIATAIDGEASLKDIFDYEWVNENSVVSVLAKGFIWRAALGFAVAALGLFVYSAIRYKVATGLLVTGASVVGTALTVAIVGLCRIPVTANVLYAFAFAFIFSVRTFACEVFKVLRLSFPRVQR